MESIVKKLFLISTAALAIAVTLTSVSTQAFECPTGSTTCTNDLGSSEQKTFGMDSTFKFTIDRVFQLKGVTGATIDMGSKFVNESESLSANVISNVPFSISLKGATSADLAGQTAGNTRAIPAGTTIVAGTDAWGIKKYDATGADYATNYTALTTTAQPFYTSQSGPNFQPASGTTAEKPGQDFNFPIGVSVSATLPADTYSTAVTVTLSDQL